MTGKKWLFWAPLAIVVAIAVILFAPTNKRRARRELELGLADTQQARFSRAIDHFKRAVQLDPELLPARRALADVYSEDMYVRGAQTPDNDGYARLAIEQYEVLLKQQPHDLAAMRELGLLYADVDIARFDEARQLCSLVTQLNPDDGRAFYCLGWADRNVAQHRLNKEKVRLGITGWGEITDKGLCTELRGRYEGDFADGIEMIQTALDKKAERSAEIRAAMSDLYYTRAATECDVPNKAAADRRTAEQWRNAP